MKYNNPRLTVDVIIELDDRGVVFVERKNPPFGWALPGGFVEVGETLEDSAIREAFEETSLKVRLRCQLHAYSDPKRDARMHTVTVVFVAEAGGEPKANSDAKGVGVFREGTLPPSIAFDHAVILKDYFRWKNCGFDAFKIS